MTEPRRWTMYAGRHDDEHFSHFYQHASLVSMCGYRLSEIFPVVLIEDPDGPYKGWTEPDGTLSMIVHHQLFEVQFPYGSQVEEKRGKGLGIRVRAELAPEDES